MKIDRHLFRTGVPVIDNQHEQYLNLVEQLFVVNSQAHSDDETFKAALRSVLAYSIEHFDAEEALMRSLNYPGYEAHVRKHDEFRLETDRWCEPEQQLSAPDLRLIELNKWLLVWFCEQTQVYDKGLAVFLSRRNEKERLTH